MDHVLDAAVTVFPGCSVYTVSFLPHSHKVGIVCSRDYSEDGIIYSKNKERKGSTQVFSVMQTYFC